MSVINILLAIFAMWPFQSGLATGVLILVPIGIFRRTTAPPWAAQTGASDSEKNDPQTFHELAARPGILRGFQAPAQQPSTIIVSGLERSHHLAQITFTNAEGKVF
jgi:hypothetical protein